jgi:uncharacterized protein YgiB involved in biofilm formation
MAGETDDRKLTQDRRIAAAMLAGVLTLFAALLTLTLTQKNPDYVMVLVTENDCRRLFNDEQCGSIVTRAQALHARSAPRYADLGACTLVYGIGRCHAVTENNIALGLFAPDLAAIALTRDMDLVLPLHYGPMSESGPEATRAGRAVYFRNRKVGRLSETSMGGADLPMLNDPDGTPLTAGELRRVGS